MTGALNRRSFVLCNQPPDAILNTAWKLRFGCGGRSFDYDAGVMMQVLFRSVSDAVFFKLAFRGAIIGIDMQSGIPGIVAVATVSSGYRNEVDDIISSGALSSAATMVEYAQVWLASEADFECLEAALCDDQGFHFAASW